MQKLLSQRQLLSFVRSAPYLQATSGEWRGSFLALAKLLSSSCCSL